MKILDVFRVRRELRRGGSTPFEADQLEEFARKLKEIEIPVLDRTTKDEIASQIGFNPVHLGKRHRLQFAGTFMALIVVSLLSQTANPGSPLYALKRASEDVRSTVQPSYKEKLDDRRQNELDELKRDKAAEEQITQAEDDLKEAQEQAEEAAKNRVRGQSGSENKVDESEVRDVRGRSTDDSGERGDSGNSGGGSGEDSGQGRGRSTED